MKYAQHFIIYAICDAVYDDVIYLFSTTSSRKEKKKNYSTCTNGNDDYYIVTSNTNIWIRKQTNRKKAKSDDFSYTTRNKKEEKVFFSEKMNFVMISKPDWLMLNIFLNNYTRKQQTIFMQIQNGMKRRKESCENVCIHSAVLFFLFYFISYFFFIQFN